jgi:hypothetical protein
VINHERPSLEIWAVVGDDSYFRHGEVVPPGARSAAVRKNAEQVAASAHRV